MDIFIKDDKPLLSICIPTFNRAKYIDQLLKSICNQVDERNKIKIEIVISDNGSTDETSEIVSKWNRNSIININYKKFNVNRGIDANILSAVEMAQGEFCWLLGSDDYVEDERLYFLLEKLQHNLEIDIFVLNYINRKSSFEKFLERNRVFVQKPAMSVNENDKIFDSAPMNLGNIWVWMGFISRLVFKKSQWDKVVKHEDFIGSQYVHIYKIYSMVKNYSKLMHIAYPIFGGKQGNDSIVNDIGSFERIRIDIENYTLIAETVFGRQAKETYLVKKAVVTKLCFNWAIWMKYYKGLRCYNRKIFYIMFSRYSTMPSFWIKVVPVFVLPSWVVKITLNTSRYFGKG